MNRVHMLLYLIVVMIISGCSTEKLISNKQTIASVVARITNDCTNETEIVEKIYYFVRDEIEFGWTYPQNIPPEEVLNRRRGVCMQKANLMVAMMREAGIQARFHFMYVHKSALEDFVPAYAYKNWVDPFIHTFPEVYLNGKWISVEATFDKELHLIALNHNLNFAKNPEIREAVDIVFSTEGVKGHQQYTQAEGMDSFYGESLEEFMEYLHSDVPLWKRAFQRKIFRDSQKILDDFRQDYRKKSDL